MSALIEPMKNYPAYCRICDRDHVVQALFLSSPNSAIRNGVERVQHSHPSCMVYARALYTHMTGSGEGFDGREIDRPWLSEPW
jgi:hypothetical protein